MIIGGLAKANGKVWLVSAEMGALFSFDEEKKELKWVAWLDDNPFDEVDLYGNLAIWENIITIFPSRGDQILFIDINSMSIARVQLTNIISVKQPKYRSILQKGRYVYGIGFFEDNLLKIDISKQEVSYLPISADVKKQGLGLMFASTNTDKIVYINNTKEYIYSLEEEKCLERVLPHTIDTINGTCVINDVSLFFEKESGIIWRKKDEELKKIVLPQEMKRGLCSYVQAIPFKDCVWIMPYRSNLLLRYDYYSDSIECITKYEGIRDRKFIYAGMFCDNFIWGYDSVSDEIQIIDMITEEVSHYSVSEVKNSEEVIKGYPFVDALHEKQYGISLEDFIEVLGE